MKKVLSLLMMAIFCATGWAETSSLIFTEMVENEALADDGVKWTIKSDTFAEGYDEKSGIQYGSNKSGVRFVEFSTNDIKGTVTNVVVNTRDLREAATVSVRVGDVNFTCEGSTTATKESSDFSFSGTGSGFVLISIDRGEYMTNAIYVKSIIVTYQNGDVLVITVNPDFGEYEGVQTVYVNVDKMPDGASIAYNFAAYSPKADLEWQSYDETKGIVIDKSGVLTVAVNSDKGEELGRIEGEYVISGITTGIDAISTKSVAGLRYYNVAGMASDTAFNGVNIVVTNYTDGTQHVTKVVK